MYRQSEKKLVKQHYLLYMSSQYGELRPTSCWDRFVSLGHPCKFQLVSRLGSVTARHSSSGRQPNFAALNRGRHLCSAGRPSRWALAHILVFYGTQLRFVQLSNKAYDWLICATASAPLRNSLPLFTVICYLVPGWWPQYGTVWCHRSTTTVKKPCSGRAKFEFNRGLGQLEPGRMSWDLIFPRQYVRILQISIWSPLSLLCFS